MFMRVCLCVFVCLYGVYLCVFCVCVCVFLTFEVQNRKGLHTCVQGPKVLCDQFGPRFDFVSLPIRNLYYGTNENCRNGPRKISILEFTHMFLCVNLASRCLLPTDRKNIWISV